MLKRLFFCMFSFLTLFSLSTFSVYASDVNIDESVGIIVEDFVDLGETDIIGGELGDILDRKLEPSTEILPRWSCGQPYRYSESRVFMNSQTVPTQYKKSIQLCSAHYTGTLYLTSVSQGPTSKIAYYSGTLYFTL